MKKSIRRIVTGHNSKGKSVFLIDGDAPNSFSLPNIPQMVITDLWVTHDAPGSNSGVVDEAPAGKPIILHPPKRGSVFRVADLPPDSEFKDVNMTSLLGQIQASDALDSDARHFWFHKTSTVDYAIVLEGEIWAMMDEGETLMRTGDVLIQRGTNHSWSNRTDKFVRMGFILIDAIPYD